MQDESQAALLNADYKKVEEQMAQSKKVPTVLVKSDVVGNHRYSVPEYAKWADIVEANDKAFAMTTSALTRKSLAATARLCRLEHPDAGENTQRK